MKRLLLASLLVLAPGIALGGDALSGKELPAILEKLGAWQKRVRPIYEHGNYKYAVHTENLDSKGKPTSVEDSLYEHAGEDDNLLKKTRDNKDVTAEQKAKDAKKKKDADDDEDFTSPFDLAEQSKYTFTFTPGDPRDTTHVRIHFEPKTRSRQLMIGDAVVDPAAGTAVTVAMHPSKLPTLVSRADILMEYAISGPSGPMVSTVTVEGEGGILFVKKRLHIVTTFSDYAAPPEK